MGRLSLEHKRLLKPILRYKLEPREVQERIKACEKVLNSVLRSRGMRKKMYKEQLMQALKYLAVESHVQIFLRKKIKDLEEENTNLRRKINEVTERNIWLEVRWGKKGKFQTHN